MIGASTGEQDKKIIGDIHWNSANPIERKKITKRNIMLKCFLLYFFGGTIIEVLTNVFLS